jgi:hypothetical protein
MGGPAANARDAAARSCERSLLSEAPGGAANANDELDEIRFTASKVKILRKVIKNNLYD